MKTLCLLILTVTLAQAENVAVWFVGPNTNYLPTNYPVASKRIGEATSFPGAHAVMTIEEFRALKASLLPAWQLVESNRLWQAENAVAVRRQAFETATARLADWEKFLGTPQNSASNLVNIAQASQWAREMIWLQKRLIQAMRPLYKPEEDEQ